MGSLKCPVCQSLFHRSPSKIKSAKTGILFCSRECKDGAQRGNVEFDGMEKIAHRITNRSKYRSLVVIKECVDCGLAYKPILVIHHIDGDRTNNVPENLEVLCPQHHALRHLKLGAKGKWIYKPSSLTPREKLKELLNLSLPK